MPETLPAVVPRRSRIAIVEDHALLAETVGLALSAEGFTVTVADLSDAAAAVASTVPDDNVLVLLDLELGDPIGDGTRLIPSLRDAGAAVLVVSGVRDRVRLAATIEAGAIGYLGKDEPFEVLLDITMRAAAGQAVMDPNDRFQLLAELRQSRAAEHRQQAPFEALTRREREVLAELSIGKSVDTIAREWVVSPATVRTQVRGVLTKLEVTSQLAAVAKARAAGWAP